MNFFKNAVKGLDNLQAQTFMDHYEIAVGKRPNTLYESLSPLFLERLAAMHLGCEYLGDEHGPDLRYNSTALNSSFEMDVKSNYNFDRKLKKHKFTISAPLGTEDDKERYLPGHPLVHVSLDPAREKNRVLSTVIFAIKPNIVEKRADVINKKLKGLYKNLDQKFKITASTVDIVSVVYFDMEEYNRKFPKPKGMIKKLADIWQNKHPIQKLKLRKDQIEKDIFEYYKSKMFEFEFFFKNYKTDL
jgi:hypothetical protein